MYQAQLPELSSSDAHATADEVLMGRLLASAGPTKKRLEGLRELSFDGNMPHATSSTSAEMSKAAEEQKLKLKLEAVTDKVASALGTEEPTRLDDAKKHHPQLRTTLKAACPVSDTKFGSLPARSKPADALADLVDKGFDQLGAADKEKIKEKEALRQRLQALQEAPTDASTSLDEKKALIKEATDAKLLSKEDATKLRKAVNKDPVKEEAKRKATQELEEAIKSGTVEEIKEALRVAKAAKIDSTLIVTAEERVKQKVVEEATEKLKEAGESGDPVKLQAAITAARTKGVDQALIDEAVKAKATAKAMTDEAVKDKAKKEAAEKLEEAIKSGTVEEIKEAIRVAKAAKVDQALIAKAEAERKNGAKRQKTKQPAPGRPEKRERPDDSAGSSASDAKRQAGPHAGTAQAAAPAVEPTASPAGEPAVSPSAATPAATLVAPPAGQAAPPTAESINPVVEMDDAEPAAAVAPSAEEPAEPPATSDE